MFTLDTDRRSCINHALATGAAALFTAVFGAVYEHYSHGVYSYFMIYAFAPLLIACLVYISAAVFFKNAPKRTTRNLFTAAAATAAVGMAAKGVVVIYGSTNRLLPVYAVAAVILLMLSAVSYISDRIEKAAQSEITEPQQRAL